MKICTGLQFKKNSEGKLILQAKWAEVQFSGTYALQLTSPESDWQDVDLANEVLPVEVDAIAGLTTADPIEQVKEKTVSDEEEEAKKNPPAPRVKEKK